jgi:hypothetical protein
MPIIKVWCLPHLEEEELNALHKDIVKAVVGIRELGFKDENDMTCLFPSDMMKYGLGSEIIVEISGLFVKPERTASAIDSLAFQVGCAVSRRFQKAKIEVLVYPFNAAYGFWTCKSYEELKSRG